MEYFEGVTLNTYLKSNPSDSTILILLKQLLSAVSYLHSRGTFHRDLKPSNLLVSDTPDGPSLRILDFGLSLKKISNSKSSPTFKSTCGTLPYLNPESFSGQEIPCYYPDMWAVGVIVWLMVHKSMPFGDSNCSTHIIKQYVSEGLDGLKKREPLRFESWSEGNWVRLICEGSWVRGSSLNSVMTAEQALEVVNRAQKL